jgi:alpha-L-rhamnosidase
VVVNERAGGAWAAAWISMGPVEEDEEGRGSVSYLRRVLTLPEAPRRVVARATALGIYRLYVNGVRVSDIELAPGWTDYTARIEYQTYDLTALFRPGPNSVEMVVAPGWWAGHVAWFGNRLYGDRTAASAEMELVHVDGRTEVVTTDAGAWRGRRGRVIASDLLMGEAQDLRAWSPGASSADDPEAWRPVTETPAPDAAIEPQRSEPVRATVRVGAVTCTQLSPDLQLLDFGQDLTGRLHLRVSGAPGARVVIRHGEALDDRGRLYTANLRSATQRNVFTLAGGGHEVLEPEFTMQGFRYAEVSGEVAPLRPQDATALVLHSDLPLTGTFRTSDPLLDRIQQNVLWTQRGTFVVVPVDCSQRDERLGWTGDINLFADAAVFNMDCSRFLGSWLTSVVDGQAEDGSVPDVGPWVRAEPPVRDIGYGQPGWGDAIVGVPWTLYCHYGDRRFLADHWEAMRRWMGFVTRSGQLIRPGGVYSDWNALERRTPSEIIGTYWFARTAEQMAWIATILDDPAAVDEYSELRQAIGRAFEAEFLRPDGTLHVPTQTGYVLALDAGLVQPGGVEGAARALLDDLESNDWHPTTGFVGTAPLLPVLTRHGFADVAYRLATSVSYPSWGFQVVNDATTVWEHWDSWHPVRGFQSPRMNSLNHFAFASIGSWLYRWVAGIRPDPAEPGYRMVVLSPHPHPSVRTAVARYDSVRGTITSRWFHDEEHLRLWFTIPPTARGRFSARWLTDEASIVSLEGTASVDISSGQDRPVSLAIGPGSLVLTVPAALISSKAGQHGDPR